MVKRLPFRITPEEQREIKEIARVFFRNGHPEADPEIKNNWLKYQIFFEAFIYLASAKDGDMLGMPFEGGIFDQPYKTMCILLEIQGAYRQYICEETEKAKRKAKLKRR